MIFTDQLGRKIQLAKTPKRIISLVPSQTELLYDLGLSEEVIGITKFCIHPEEWFRTKTRVGGTKKLDFKKIKQLQPDLIIGNKEENEQSQIEELCKNYSVWLSDITTLKDALNMIVAIGALVGKNEEATNIKVQIEFLFHQFNNQQSTITNKNVAYFIWQNPFMVVGRDTFINDMLIRCGFINVFATPKLSRYSVVKKEQIALTNPDVILLSTEPFPFKDKHIHEFKSLCPNAKIIIVDGELFSWYGSRLLQTPVYFTKLIQSFM